MNFHVLPVPFGRVPLRFFQIWFLCHFPCQSASKVHPDPKIHPTCMKAVIGVIWRTEFLILVASFISKCFQFTHVLLFLQVWGVVEPLSENDSRSKFWGSFCCEKCGCYQVTGRTFPYSQEFCNASGSLPLQQHSVNDSAVCNARLIECS